MGNVKGKIIVWVFVCLFLSKLTYSQVNLVRYTQTPPTIDGVIDKEWSLFDTSGINHIIEGSIDSNTDLGGDFTLTWDENNLYALVRITDDNVYSNNNADILLDDGIELYIDGNNNKQNSYGTSDFHYEFRVNDPKTYETIHNATSGVVCAQSKTASSITYEIKFPWSVLGKTSIKNYASIGFDIFVNDNDNKPSRDAKLAWFATQLDPVQNPSLFGTATLTGKPSLGVMNDPMFSQKRGVYTAAFPLTLSSPDQNATIVYTLDGSDPRSSSTSLTGISPVTMQIDPSSNTNRGGLTPAVVVRATCAKADYDSSKVITHSYIFIESVKTQSTPGGIWPAPYASWGSFDSQEIDYEMDPDIVNATAYKDSIDDALLQIPSISVVTDNGNLFDKTTGIYMNAISQGDGWEKPASVELINPDGSAGFQINGGLRMRGGYSRQPDNPKHSFRLFFNKEYGESELNFPLFEAEGTSKFKKVDICTAQNYSWSKEGSIQNTFLKDLTCRDIQGKMNHPYTRSRYYHLYINGMYWGLYLTEERPDARFASDYMGGNVDDYDVMKPERNIVNTAEDLKIVSTDGRCTAIVG